MKQYLEVITEKFQDLMMLVGEDKYSEAFRTTQALTRLADAHEDSDGVFVFEVFEAMFEQINGLMQGYEVTEEDQRGIHELSHRSIDAISKAFGASDKTALYAVLRDFRYGITHSQLRYWDKGKKKTQEFPPYGITVR